MIEDDRECTCDFEPNALASCPKCGLARFFVRDPRLLGEGDIVGYDPICGYSVPIEPPEKGRMLN